MSSITQEEVEAIQRKWGQSILDVGKAHQLGEDHRERALTLIRELYGYHLGDVAFKPTLAAERQFRNDIEGALSYFIGGNSNYSEDKGFALNGWVDVRFENSNIICHGDTALAMGNYFFTSKDGSVTKVEYSFAYQKHGEDLLIRLHHSSFPHQA